MLTNYWKFILRNLSRNLGHTSINVFGLSLGITCSLTLFLMISYFKSFDQFNEKADNIYRVVTAVNENGGVRTYGAGLPKPLPDAFRERFPEVRESSVFVQKKYDQTLFGIESLSEGLRYYQVNKGVAYTEQSYFDVFTRPLIYGDEKSALNAPNQVVISQSLAEQYFPSKNPIGEVLLLDKEIPLKITGVIEDHPENTSFPFDVLISYLTVKSNYIDSGWDSFSGDSHFYLVVEDERILSTIKSELPRFTGEHYGENIYKRSFQLQTLDELHTDRRFNNFGAFVIGKGEFLSMWLVSIFMIVTACINFINLSTAIAIKRSKEVGIRKVLGSRRFQLIIQFLIETFVVTSFALLISIGFSEMLVMSVNSYLHIDIQIKLLTDISLQLYLLGLLLLVTLLAGAYPSFVLSGYKPIQALKSRLDNKRKGKFSLRRSLVVFQLLMSQLYIIGTIILLAQLDYMKGADPGFTSEKIVMIPMADSDTDKFKTLENKFNNLADISKVSLTSDFPSSYSRSSTVIRVEGFQDEFKTTLKYIDHNYIDLFDIPLVAGRNLLVSDTITSVLVNEAWGRDLGLDHSGDAVGMLVDFWDKKVPVRGVVSDFHTRSMSHKIEPLMLMSNVKNHAFAAVKITNNDTQSSIGNMVGVWKDVYPEYDFNYYFVEDQLANMYVKEEKMFGILSVFSLITIFISAMGLFGLASFMANRKVKEVGVRKVLGASVYQIVSIFSKEYVRMISIAFLIAAPMIWYGMKLWLSNFEYHVEINVFMFIAGVILISFIALITVVVPTWSASLANPAKSLRDE